MNRNTLHSRRYHYRVKYGITLEQYDEMLRQQGGVCALCHQHPTRQFDVDHDHETGKVRGLLCHRCNISLAFFRDDPDLMDRMREYLRKVNP